MVQTQGKPSPATCPPGSAKTLLTALLPELRTHLEKPEQVQTLIDGFKSLSTESGDRTAAEADISSKLPAPALTAISNAVTKSGIQIADLNSNDMSVLAWALETLKGDRAPTTTT